MCDENAKARDSRSKKRWLVQNREIDVVTPKRPKNALFKRSIASNQQKFHLKTH